MMAPRSSTGEHRCTRWHAERVTDVSSPEASALRCQAIDFRVMGSHHKGLLQYLALREDVGGLKRYPLGFYHIDTGPRRTW